MGVIQPELLREDSISDSTLSTVDTFTVPNQPQPILKGLQFGAETLSNYDYGVLESSEIEEIWNGTDLRVEPLQNYRDPYMLSMAIPVEKQNKISLSGYQSSGDALDFVAFLLMQYDKGKSVQSVKGKKLSYVTLSDSPSTADEFSKVADLDVSNLKNATDYAIRRAYVYGSNLNGARIEHPNFDGLYWHLPSGTSKTQITQIDYQKMYGTMPVINTSSSTTIDAVMSSTGTIDGMFELVEL